jgi:hypothetical protein
MSGFGRHATIGAGVGVLVAGAIVTMLSIQDPAVRYGLGALGFAATTVGGVIADIDSHSSIPRRYLNGVLIITVGVGAAALAGMHISFSSLIPTIRITQEVILAGIGATLVAAIIVPSLVQGVMPSHRGVLHSIWFWAAVLLTPVLLLRLGFIDAPGPDIVKTHVIPIVAVAVLVGVAAHLLEDGELP